MAFTRTALAAVMAASLLAMPATAKTRNEVLAEVEAGCAADASACAAILEAAVEATQQEVNTTLDHVVPEEPSVQVFV